MSEYYFTGSPDYLEHHGILGMKWGVRRFQNKDGSLTPEGMARYRKTNALQKDLIKKTLEGIHANTSDMSGVEKLFSMTGASKDSMNKAYDICESYTKEIKDLSKECDNLVSGLDKGTRAYYEAATEISSSALYYNKKPEDLTIEDIGNNGFMGCLEDGQQQSVNAISYYIHETGQTEKASNIEKKYNNISSSSRDSLKETLSSAFDEVGAEELDKNFHLSNSLSTTMMYKFETKNRAMSDGFYQVVYSEGGHKYTDKELNSVDEAKKVVDHFDGSHDSNTWWYVNEAAENLGFSSTRAADMTQADWDKLNAEIRKLRASMNHSAINDELYHHGILGMKWGVRRFQNPDGSLTPEGRARYGDVLTKKQMKNYIREYNLRTGSNKTINKNTVFKTPNGMYDYKGRKLRNADVEVENPTEEKKTNAESKPSDKKRMTDDELRAANERMRLEEEYLKHIANLNPKKVSLGQQFTNNLKNELMTSIPRGISGMIENAIKNAGNANPKSGNANPKSGNEQKNTEQKKEKTKTEEPKTTQTTGVNPEKLNDKDLADYVQRMTNLNRATEARKIFDDKMTKAGEEFMQDYWAKDDKNNRSYRLVERSLADQQGIPLNPDDIRYRLEDKKHK